MINFDGKTALITGGTRGIGLATALMLSRFGAHCILTYCWGSADETELLRQFKELGAKEPLIIQADIINKEDTQLLFDEIKKRFNYIDIFISNVSNALIIKCLEDYSLRDLQKSISYCAWPLYAYTWKMKEIFGCCPRYVIGLSSSGIDHYAHGYDYVAASKALMETLCRYMSYRLREESISINVVRSRSVRTESLEWTFGKKMLQFAKQVVPDDYWIAPEEVAGAIAVLCSGLMDAIKGQVLNVDRGSSFSDTLMDLYTRSEQLPIFQQQS